jgi:putative ABC transport system permease protein
VIWLVTLRLAIRNLLLHKMRSILTLLGTILGVASVIAMLAIGEGSKQEALEQIRRLGASNVILKSIKPPPSANAAALSTTSSYVLAYGLSYADLRRVEDGVADAIIVPSIIHRKSIQHAKHFFPGLPIVGTTPELARVRPFEVRGRFLNEEDIAQSANVVVIGEAIAANIFEFENPVGQSLLIGDDAFRVIGVARYPFSGPIPPLNASSDDRNQDLYIPITAAKNRMGIVQRIVETGSRQYVRMELSEITLKLAHQEEVRPTAAVIRTLLSKSHPGKSDYEVQVPLELLNQAEREKRLWNLVLGSIAGISLLVGGIGIMNIMLATVTERTREIGIRRAIGAKRSHIILQFLMETTVLSTGGGILGVLVGVLLPWLVTLTLGIQTVTSFWSILLAFGISVATGVVFGVYPAYKAALMNPIEALRHQ